MYCNVNVYIIFYNGLYRVIITQKYNLQYLICTIIFYN